MIKIVRGFQPTFFHSVEDKKFPFPYDMDLMVIWGYDEEPRAVTTLYTDMAIYDSETHTWRRYRRDVDWYEDIPGTVYAWSFWKPGDVFGFPPAAINEEIETRGGLHV